MRVFHQSLSSLAAITGKAVPPFLESCFSFLMDKLDVEGIFRVPGLDSDIQRFIALADASGTVEFPENTSPFVVANLLTRFIAKIPNHILEDRNADSWTALTDVAKAKSLISDLPPMNRAVLSRLLAFFLKVIEHGDKNRMGKSNIGIILSPILITNNNDNWWLLKQETVAMLLDNYETLFGENAKIGAPSCLALDNSGRFLTSDEFETSIEDLFNMLFAQSCFVKPELVPVVEEKQQRMCRNVQMMAADVAPKDLFDELLSTSRSRARILTPI